MAARMNSSRAPVGPRIWRAFRARVDEALGHEDVSAQATLLGRSYTSKVCPSDAAVLLPSMIRCSVISAPNGAHSLAVIAPIDSRFDQRWRARATRAESFFPSALRNFAICDSSP